MARTALLCALPALLISTGWSQLEARPKGGEILLVAALAVGAALLPRRWLQLVGGVAAFLAVAGLAFGVSPLDARPFHDRDFFGPLLSGVWNGSLDFYEISIPFDSTDRPRMHGVLLLAVFVFTLGASLAIARRRPVLASALTFAGAAWPVTLIRDAPATARGALLLVAALILLAVLRPGAGRATGQTALVGGAVLVAALVAVSSPAVAKGGFLNWEQWEPYKRPERPVSVSYVWDDADYDGIRFPKRPTTVLTVKAPRSAPYWRATTLDSFLDDRWRHDQLEIEPTEVEGLDVLLDPLLPPNAADSDTWMEQKVTVHALRDDHLVAASVPIAFERGEAVYYEPGVAYVERLRRGQDYRVWSYVPRPSPKDLAASPAAYPDEVAGDQYLGTGFGTSAPPFGTPDRGVTMRQIFSDEDARVYEPLYDTALEVAGRRAANPYAAVVALEAWFRQSGDFRYDEQPPSRPGVPPLVAFVDDHRRGYCQHFAGAMALMLRYLGIPARVGAGFTSGQYDTEDREWTVSDKNAHTWVEVWFAGYGWLPFDPTPGPGRLRGSYSASSLFFDVNGAAGAFGVGAAGLGLDILRERLGDGGPNAANDRARGLDPGGVPVGGGQTGADDGGGGASLIALLLAAAAALTAGLWLLKLVRRHLRYLTRDPRRLAGAVRLDLVDYLVDQRVRVSSSATPAELGRELERRVGVGGDRLVSALAAARYGPEAQAEGAARHARRELRSVRRGLRRRLGTWARLRGLVSLRSLGLGSA